MNSRELFTPLGFLIGLLLVCAFSACSDPGSCESIELLSGKYEVKFSQGFENPPPMEKGTLVYDPEKKRVTISYESPEGPAEVVLGVSSAENAP
jgi:hypothetical protein